MHKPPQKLANFSATNSIAVSDGVLFNNDGRHVFVEFTNFVLALLLGHLHFAVRKDLLADLRLVRRAKCLFQIGLERDKNTEK